MVTVNGSPASRECVRAWGCFWLEEERTARACFVAAMGETTAEVEEPLPLSPCLEELRVEAVEESLEELFFLLFLFLDVALRGAGRSVLGLRTATMGDVSMERTLLFFVGVVVVDVDRFFFFFGVEVVERRDLNLLVVVLATSSRAGGGAFFVTFIVVAAVVVLEDSSFLVLLEEERLLLLLEEDRSFLFLLWLLLTDFADVATAQAFFFLMLGEEDAFCSRCGGCP